MDYQFTNRKKTNMQWTKFMNILKRFAPELLTMSIIRKPLGDKDGAQNVILYMNHFT